jgi:hypothetical protein
VLLQGALPLLHYWAMAFIEVVEDERSTVLAELVTTHDCYLLPDGAEAFIGTAAAWCHDCRNFVLVERLRSAEELEATAREYFGPSGRYPVRRAERALLLDKFLHEAAQWGIALKTRKSPSRCLECGSTRHVLLPPKGDWADHPGGVPARVRARDAMMHARMAEWGRLYDTEGLRLLGRFASR